MSHILIVDDEPQIRSMLAILLGQQGYKVTEAEDGDAALKVLQSAEIDLIILDLLMPGKEGLETLMALRKEKAAPKIIAMSGGARSVGADFLPAALKLGAGRALRKPFRNEDMLTAIRELLAPKE